MINKIGVAFIRIIFVYFLGLNAAAFGAQIVAGDNAPRGARDGVLNVADVLLAQRFVLGQETPSAEELLVADVAPVGAPDGVLNVADLLVLQRAVNGLVTLSPINTGPNAPVLNSIASSTTVNPFVITGTAAPNVTIRLYVNNQLQTSTTTSGSGSFAFESALYDGDNTIHATTYEGNEESASSNSLSITYTNTISRTQSGAITTDTVWTPGVPAQPYVVASGDLTVNAGAQLVIQAGTIIQFTGGGRLVVNGGLIVNGTADSPVEFKGAPPTYQTNWSGIRIANTATNVAVKHAIISYANKGLWINSDSVLIEKCVLQNNLTGIYIDNASPAINSNTISNNYRIGIEIIGGANPQITHNIITSNPWYGIKLIGTSPAGPGPQPVVHDNKIYNNYGNGSTSDVYCDWYYFTGEVPTVDMTGNWWGTTNAGLIASHISDFADNNGDPKPVVDFSGYYLDEAGASIDQRQLLPPITVPTNDVTIDAGNYLVLSPVQISAGITLTINAGANLYFVPAAYVGVNIHGSLEINGQPDNLVTLTSAWEGATSSTYQWKGITIYTDATSANIHYGNIHYAKNGVYFDNVTGTVDNSILSGNNVALYLKGNTQVLLDSNVITGNLTGIYLDGAVVDPNPVITNNDIYTNNNRSLYLNSIETTTVLNNSNNWWGSTVAMTIRATMYSTGGATSLTASVPLSSIATESHAGVTTINLRPLSSPEYYAPALISLSADAITNISGRTLTKVSYYNGTTLLGESTSPPYSFDWSNVPAGTPHITAVVTDNTGSTTTSPEIIASVKSTSLYIFPSIDGTTVNDDHMLVVGYFYGPSNTGITVNGVLANLVLIGSSSQGTAYRYYANNVPLTVGSNLITVNLVSQDGQTATASATVTSTGSPGFSIIAQQFTGISPASFTFDYKNNTAQAVSEIRVSVDGVVHAPVTNPANEITFGYSGYTASVVTPMLFTFTVLGVPAIPTDPPPVLYTTTQEVIINTSTAQDAIIKPVITGMFSQLKQGSKTVAIQALSSEARNTYGGVFDALMPYTATISSELSNVETISSSNDSASHAILRAENGVNKVYIINSIKDKDGVWRIDSM